MQSPVPRALIWFIVGSGLTALWGLDQGVFWLGATFKPLTTALLFFVLGRMDTPLRRKVGAGLGFALVGDIALLGQEEIWFQVGLGAFLVTHLFYIAAFLPLTVKSVRPIVAAVLGTAASVGTIVLAYPEASSKGLAVPVAVYALVLTGTVVSANATVGGPLRQASWGAWGALFFYVADTSIALTLFVPSLSLPHPVLFTTGLYWVGQYLIIAAARAGVATKLP